MSLIERILGLFPGDFSIHTTPIISIRVLTRQNIKCARRSTTNPVQFADGHRTILCVGARIRLPFFHEPASMKRVRAHEKFDLQAKDLILPLSVLKGGDGAFFSGF